MPIQPLNDKTRRVLTNTGAAPYVPSMPVFLPPIPQWGGGQVQIPAPPPPEKTSWWKNPNLPSILMSMGAALSGPPQMGVGTAGRIGQALAQGYNTLLTNRLYQQQAQQQEMENAWKRSMEAARLGGEMGAKQEEFKVRREDIKQKEEAAKEQARLEGRRIGVQEQYYKDLNAYWNRTAGFNEDKLAAEVKKWEQESKDRQAQLAEARRSNMAREKIAGIEARAAQAQAAAAMLRARATMNKTGVEDPDQLLLKDSKAYWKVMSDLVKATNPYPSPDDDPAAIVARAHEILVTGEKKRQEALGQSGAPQGAPQGTVAGTLDASSFQQVPGEGGKKQWALKPEVAKKMKEGGRYAFRTKNGTTVTLVWRNGRFWRE